MSTRLRLVSLCGFFVVACTTPEASHLRNQTGSAGTNGAAGTGAGGTAAPTGMAGTTVPTGMAGTSAGGDNGAAGAAGTNGGAGDNGSAGSAGSAAGDNGMAGSAAGDNGMAGMAGSTAGTTGTAGATAGTTGTAGATAGTTGTAGSTAGTTGTAGAGGAAGTGGAAGMAVPGTYSNWCSPVHWTYSAMTATHLNDLPSNVVDGNIVSRWSTGANQAPGQYFQIDFGGTVSLTQVVLDASNNVGDYPKGYDVGLSAAGTTFTSVGTGAPTTPIVTVSFNAAQGRYLRITQTGTVTNWWSIDELHVTCTVPGNNAGLIDPYDPQYWKASASVSAAAYPAGGAIDGDSTTRWSTGQAMAVGDNFTVDLGAPAMIQGVTYDCGGGNDFPVGYKLEVSTDCTNYTQVATGAGASGLTKIMFARQNVRCFRLTETAVGTNWLSIYGISLTP
jgi:hypothetical protein